MGMTRGTRMMAINRMTQGNRMQGQNRSEYGASNRRMIGYDRDMNGNANRYEGNAYGTESRMRERYNEGGGWENNGYGARNEYDEGRYGTSGSYNTESRRRRDSRGRYMMGGMEMDDEAESRGFQRGMPTGFPQMNGGSKYGFGDVYAEVYAPNAMNRPMHGGSQHSEHGDMSQPVDEHTARKWVQKMDGGEHFRPEQADQLRSICPSCEKWEFYTAINAMYSDHCETAKKMGMDKPEFYAHLAKDFLMDEDAKPHKLRKYMEHIAK